MSPFRLFLALLFTCGTSFAEGIRIGAAISIQDAIEEIADDFTKQTGQEVLLNFGSSGQLAAQIRNGAPIDLFISAAQRQVDELISEDLALKDSQRHVAGNSLVLIVPAQSRETFTSFRDLSSDAVKRIAIGEPKTVPAGDYAMQVLDRLGLAEALKGRMVYGTNVRQVLSYVERGEVSAGIVYRTDARAAGASVRVVAEAELADHAPIVYPAVIIKTSQHRGQAQAFLDHLATPQAQAILKSHRFTAPANDSSQLK